MHHADSLSACVTQPNLTNLPPKKTPAATYATHAAAQSHVVAAYTRAFASTVSQKDNVEPLHALSIEGLVLPDPTGQSPLLL